MLQVEFKWHISWVIEEIADRGDVNTAVILEILPMQPEEFSDR